MLNPVEEALLTAVENNDFETCQDLLTFFVNKPERYNIQATNGKGQTALHLACFYAPDVVPILSPFKLNSNVQDVQGCTPLHYACYKGHVEAVAYLCEQTEALQLELRDKAEQTPLTCAIDNGNVDIVKILLKKTEAQKASNVPHTSVDYFELLLAALKQYENEPELIEAQLLSGTYCHLTSAQRLRLIEKVINSGNASLIEVFSLFGFLSGYIVPHFLIRKLFKNKPNFEYHFLTANFLCIKGPQGEAICHASALQNVTDMSTAAIYYPDTAIISRGQLKTAVSVLESLQTGELLKAATDDERYVKRLFEAHKIWQSVIAFNWGKLLLTLGYELLVALYKQIKSLTEKSDISCYNAIHKFVTERNLGILIYQIPSEKLEDDLRQILNDGVNYFSEIQKKFIHQLILQLNLWRQDSLTQSIIHQARAPHFFTALLEKDPTQVEMVEEFNRQAEKMLAQLPHSITITRHTLFAYEQQLAAYIEALRKKMVTSVEDSPIPLILWMSLCGLCFTNLMLLLGGSTGGSDDHLLGMIALLLVLGTVVGFGGAMCSASTFADCIGQLVSVFQLTRAFVYRHMPIKFLSQQLQTPYECILSLLKIIRSSLLEPESEVGQKMAAILNRLQSSSIITTSRLVTELTKVLPLLQELIACLDNDFLHSPAVLGASVAEPVTTSSPQAQKVAITVTEKRRAERPPILLPWSIDQVAFWPEVKNTALLNATRAQRPLLFSQIPVARVVPAANQPLTTTENRLVETTPLLIDVKGKGKLKTSK